ncbi:AAA family ATPase [Mycolicibacterium rhodesiae]|uniref:AAA family ATPase n=1 Tax=Mycolicibacterium rhodesiae TaxID=36814 RepID=UPI0013FE2379|nr:LuxR family transcriptional regulator [Mycolicibacterium rhodesiae]MCV7345181.1 AAA family ATPase [Mycolicibacterium rhodesiae]
MGGIVGRIGELQTIQGIIQQARHGPAALVLDGEAGIGKTTLWRAAGQWARTIGFVVLTATGAAIEMSMAWAGLADLLAGIDEVVLAGLPLPQRRVLESVSVGRLHTGADQRLVATALRGALDALSRHQPVLVAIDDAHWLDNASTTALGFAIRRLTGPIGVLATFRSGTPDPRDDSWVAPRDPKVLTRLTLNPMSPGDLRALIADRDGSTPPPPVLQRLHTLSGGNPSYALELSLAWNQQRGSSAESVVLPPRLAAGMLGRIGELDSETTEAIVTAAAAVEPTVELIAAATGRSSAELVDLLQPLESRGVLVFEGNQIRFIHPLMAAAVVDAADPGSRRRAHSRLAGVVDHPEFRARHLALSAPHGDSNTWAALDRAAEGAAERGAFSEAADLLAIAIRTGGDTPLRRLRAADYNFRTGALSEAEVLVAPIVDSLPAGSARASGLLLLGGVRGQRDGWASAGELLQRASIEAADDSVTGIQALVWLALATGLGGDMPSCVALARRAREEADHTGIAHLRSQALSLWVLVSFMHGLDTDTEALQTALEIEDAGGPAPAHLQPSAVYALICAWTGRLEEARSAMLEVARRCGESGHDADAVWAAEQLTTIEIWLGRYAAARHTADGALGHARQLRAGLPLIRAWTSLSLVAAHQGRVDDTYEAARQAIERATAANLTYLVRIPVMSQAFVEVSAGEYAAALSTLRPLLDTFDPAHDAEIATGRYLPDAVEALVALGRLEEAEPLVAALESNGSRLDRPWMLAAGARCRALLAAAEGDLERATRHAEQAMDHHDRLPMPFERARTQLVLGQLQRRRRRLSAAYDTLRQAADVLEGLGSSLWAARAHRELGRLSSRSAGGTLTDSERQTAEKAAVGLSNKQIATELYLSPKTVEMHLSTAYRKLGIRSRAQLAHRLRQLDTEEPGDEPTPSSAP